MGSKPSILERAFQLARSGQYTATPEIARQLRAEGYEAVAQHFDSITLKRQLIAECHQARALHSAEEEIAI